MSANTHAGGPASRAMGKTADNTPMLVRWQLEYMQCPCYEVAWHHEDTDHHEIRIGDCDAILRLVGKLGHHNAHGCHIWVKPVDGNPLVLLDDVTQQTVDKMIKVGCEPTVVVETSPGNNQAWVRVSLDPVAPDVLRGIRLYLARQYSSDPGATGKGQYGRLAGFTNRKPKHRMANGYYPFVHTGYKRKGPCTIAEHLLEIGTMLAEKESNPATQSGFLAPQARTPSVSVDRPQPRRTAPVPDHNDLVKWYRTFCDVRLSRWPDTDYSRMDFEAIADLAVAHPTIPCRELAMVMWEASPRIKERKGAHGWGYTERTVRKALASLGRNCPD